LDTTGAENNFHRNFHNREPIPTAFTAHKIMDSLDSFGLFTLLYGALLPRAAASASG
jgi:hypothetical protein